MTAERTSRTADAYALGKHATADHTYFAQLARKAISATYEQDRAFTLDEWTKVDRRLAGLAAVALDLFASTSTSPGYVYMVEDDRVILGCNGDGCTERFTYRGLWTDDGGRLASAMLAAYDALVQAVEQWQCGSCDLFAEQCDDLDPEWDQEVA